MGKGGKAVINKSLPLLNLFLVPQVKTLLPWQMGVKYGCPVEDVITG